ncbi:ead/Ea22-like family protein [Salmonella enterica]|nr:ead/Ea22-like family protein [Salmonella enterica subsp. enterica serovar Pomona]ECA5874758.1 ead/Ea22-like family protein [Salmonella enterica subsp. enterica serovar Poona]ECN3094340.1 ead/Ea22-like family protein [Salmonella enterica subsp. enterica serovar Derby]EHK3297177.1 ead/Ea22-like family protein [Salmonella enterica]EEJ1803263.1 ead/Ea22-like family protein [Salmonella enterica subsp. enterica serovar Pomona]
MVERFSMNPVSCKLLNEAWGKEFPDEVAIAERMLALLDELEHYKSREERVTKLVLDNSTSWDALYKKLEAANRRSAELDRDCWTYENTVKTLLERAESAESACKEAARILKSGERMALTRAVNILLSVGEDAAPYRYPVVLPEPLGFKPPSGRDVLLKNDVIAALMSAGVPVERG